MQRRTKIASAVAGVLLAGGATAVVISVAGGDSNDPTVASDASTSATSTTAQGSTTRPATVTSEPATTSVRPSTPATVTPNEPGGEIPPASPGDDFPPESTGCADLAPIPADASITGGLSADVDGDGLDDRVTTYRRGSGETLRRIMRVELDDQGFEQPFGVDTFPRELAVLAAANLDDGPDLPNTTMELFVGIGGDDEHESVGVFYAEGCVLRRATDPGGNEAVFTIGRVDEEYRGLRCELAADPPRLVAVTATSTQQSNATWIFALDHFEDGGSVGPTVGGENPDEVAVLDC